jgi:hypothetical protein
MGGSTIFSGRQTLQLTKNQPQTDYFKVLIQELLRK